MRFATRPSCSERGCAGDPARGAELFQRQGCNLCHALRADEPMKGPFMGQIGAIRFAAPRWSSAPHRDGHHLAPMGVSSWAATSAAWERKRVTRVMP